MAESKDDIDMDALIEKFKSFGKNGKMQSKDCGKLVDDCLKKPYGSSMKIASDIKFGKVKQKGTTYFEINEANVELYCQILGAEAAKLEEGTKKEVTDAALIKKHTDNVKRCILGGHKHVKATKTSITGGVDKMTDSSQYTGSHKERFGEDGKGKGKGGRVDEVDNSGYVGAYKMKGTYDKK